MSGSSTVPGAVPAGYFLAGPISPSGEIISEFRPIVRNDLPTLTTYDLPNAVSSDISYDTLGQLITIAYEDGRVQTNTYDTLGQITTITTFNLIEHQTETQVLSYSTLGNITSITISYD